MSKLVLTAFAFAAIATPALADTPIDFTWEGHRIVGTMVDADGGQIIKGRDLTTRRDFELHVRNGYVNGDVGGVSVSYPVPKHKLSAASSG